MGRFRAGSPSKTLARTLSRRAPNQESLRSERSRYCRSPPRPLGHSRQQPSHRQGRGQTARHLERRHHCSRQTILFRRPPPARSHISQSPLDNQIRSDQLGPHLPREPTIVQIHSRTQNYPTGQSSTSTNRPMANQREK